VFWLQRFALWFVVVFGAFLLGVFFRPTAASLMTILGFVTIPVLIAFMVISSAAGWLIASVRNAFSLYSAHTDLAQFMRTNETFRAARRGISRPSPTA
jgi:hypothetical protein